MSTEEMKKAYEEAGEINFTNQSIADAIKKYVKNKEKDSRYKTGYRTLLIIKAYQYITGQKLYRVPMKYFRCFLFNRLNN